MKNIVTILFLAGFLSGCTSVRETVCGGANSAGYLGGPCFFLEVASDVVGRNSSDSNTPPTMATPTIPATPATAAPQEKK